MKKRWFIAVSLAASLVLSAGAQELPPNAPTKEQLANDNKLFIELDGSGRGCRWPMSIRPR